MSVLLVDVPVPTVSNVGVPPVASSRHPGTPEASVFHTFAFCAAPEATIPAEVALFVCASTKAVVASLVLLSLFACVVAVVPLGSAGVPDTLLAVPVVFWLNVGQVAVADVQTHVPDGV